MNLSFTPLQPEHAGAMVSWRYDPPYDLYNYGEEGPEVLDELLDPANGFYAVLLDGHEFIGFRSFGPDGRVQGGDYDDSCMDTGGGLRPDFTGQGLGAEVLRQGLAFGAQEFETSCFRVTIAAFNQRAIKVCQRVGFEEAQRFHRPGDGREFVVLTICVMP